MRSGPFDRFDIRPLLLDQARSLRKVELGHEDDESYKPDIAARIVLYGIPVTLAVVSYWQKWRMTDPGAISAGSALIAGILFTAFTQLAALRDRLEDRGEEISRITRRHFRETAAHLMMGAVAAAVEAAVLVAGSGIRNHPDDKLSAEFSAAALGIGCFIFLIFIMAARRMYSAYLRVFEGGRYLKSPRKSFRK